MHRYESPYHAVPDDYVWACPNDLASYCNQFAHELLIRVKRTPEERIKLATHCAALLKKVAETITGSPHDCRSPEIYCRGGGSPSKAVAGVIFQAKKSDRRIWIARAAQLVLGDGTGDWLKENHTMSDGSRLGFAGESDANFFIILRQLDDIYYQRETDEHDVAAGRITREQANREGGEEQESWEEALKRRQAGTLHTVHNTRKKRRKRWWRKNTLKINGATSNDIGYRS